MAFPLCLSRKRPSGGHSRGPQNAQNANPRGFRAWGSPALFPLPVDENALRETTPGKGACDGLFPLPVEENAIPSPLEGLGVPSPSGGLGKPWQACSAGSIESFSSTGRGKSSSQAHTKSMRRPFTRQAGGKGHHGTLGINALGPETAFSSTGRGKRQSRAYPESPETAFSSTGRGKRPSRGGKAIASTVFGFHP